LSYLYTNCAKFVASVLGSTNQAARIAYRERDQSEYELAPPSLVLPTKGDDKMLGTRITALVVCSESGLGKSTKHFNLRNGRALVAACNTAGMRWKVIK